MLAEVRFFSVVFDEGGFVIEEIEVARGTSHEELDNPLRPRRMVGDLGDAIRWDLRGTELLLEHRIQGNASKASPGGLE